MDCALSNCFSPVSTVSVLEKNVMHFEVLPTGLFINSLTTYARFGSQGLSQTAIRGSQRLLVSDITLCPRLTVHCTDIILLLSTNVWALTECWEIRPTA